jgi:hypothetical protein
MLSFSSVQTALCCTDLRSSFLHVPKKFGSSVPNAEPHPVLAFWALSSSSPEHSSSTHFIHLPISRSPIPSHSIQTMSPFPTASPSSSTPSSSTQPALPARYRGYSSPSSTPSSIRPNAPRPRSLPGPFTGILRHPAVVAAGLCSIAVLPFVWSVGAFASFLLQLNIMKARMLTTLSSSVSSEESPQAQLRKEAERLESLKAARREA